MATYEYLVGYSVETIDLRGVEDLTEEHSRSFLTVIEGTSISKKALTEIERRAGLHATAGWAVGDREIHRVNLLSISRLRKVTTTAAVGSAVPGGVAPGGAGMGGVGMK